MSILFLLLLHDVIVNFMYQLGWAVVLRYLVKHYSRCFCEGVFFVWY